MPNDLLNVDDTIAHMQDVYNTNFNSLVARLYMKPFSKSRISISLCCLAPLSLLTGTTETMNLLFAIRRVIRSYIY